MFVFYLTAMTLCSNAPHELWEQLHHVSHEHVRFIMMMMMVTMLHAQESVLDFPHEGHPRAPLHLGLACHMPLCNAVPHCAADVLTRMQSSVAVQKSSCDSAQR